MHTNANPLTRVTDNTACNLYNAVELFLEAAAAAGRGTATLRFLRERGISHHQPLCIWRQGEDALLRLIWRQISPSLSLTTDGG
ncbi:MAG: hypothetical protein RMM06_10290 [Armatimonadota bacterium]|nr:hypothetical protein [bacterium]MDW8291105.1 hypothetical protein [Armatimonadota bacterium]